MGMPNGQREWKVNHQMFAKLQLSLIVVQHYLL